MVASHNYTLGILNPFVPRAVLVAAGVVYGLLGLALLLAGIADLIDRVRARRQPSQVR
jgi:uncharacterized membrane protein HdeD (DUF308 family)